MWAYGFTTCNTTTPGSTAGGSSGSGSGSGGSGGGDAPGGGGAESLGGGAGAGPLFGAELSQVSEAPRQRYQLAGLGFGLPLSRLYERYFGGDLALQNVPGYGVDAYLTLKNLRHLSRGWCERDHL